MSPSAGSLLLTNAKTRAARHFAETGEHLLIKRAAVAQVIHSGVRCARRLRAQRLHQYSPVVDESVEIVDNHRRCGDS
jgi:hypothetical protein